MNTELNVSQLSKIGGLWVERNKDCLEAVVEDSVILLSFDKGEYYRLNAVAAEAWRLMAQPGRLSRICEGVEARFEVDKVTCYEEIHRLAQDLAELGLVALTPRED